MLYSDYTSKQQRSVSRSGMQVPAVVPVAQQRSQYHSSMARPMQAAQQGMQRSNGAGMPQMAAPLRSNVQQIPGRAPTANPPQAPWRPYGLHPEEAMRRLGLFYARNRFSQL